MRKLIGVAFIATFCDRHSKCRHNASGVEYSNVDQSCNGTKELPVEAFRHKCRLVQVPVSTLALDVASGALRALD